MTFNEFIEKFKEQYSEFQELIQALYDQLGCDDWEEFITMCKDLLTPCGCGANAGFPGFIYTNETMEFYKKNKEQILHILSDLSEGIGDRSVLDTILSFNSVDENDWETVRAIALTVWGEDSQVDQYIADILAKFAFEEIANWMDSFISENEYDHGEEDI